MVLLTGASGMLGRYVKDMLDESVLTLGRSEGNDFRVNLERAVPDFGNRKFSLIIHCAGTEDDVRADVLNVGGTQNLLRALDAFPPQYFVYISSWQVYSADGGENISEDANTWATTPAGMSKARAEREVAAWACRHGVTLTILRPARMFGNGVAGETLSLFNDAVSGKYIHIRGNDSRLSIVTAYDTARAALLLYGKGGIYNIADGRNPRFIEMVEAMTANIGMKKRMTHLPANWAEWLWRLGRWIPSIERNLNPSIVENRMKTLTLDNSKVEEATGLKFFNTIDVIERVAEDYPYESDKPKENLHANEV